MFSSLDPPNPLGKGEPEFKSEFKVPLFKGDLGGSGYNLNPPSLFQQQ